MKDYLALFPARIVLPAACAAVWLALSLPAHAAPPISTSATYTHLHNAPGTGGTHVTNAGGTISAQLSVGDPFGGGVTAATASGAVAKRNYTGNLLDAVSLAVTADPASLDEGTTRQLAATATFDDDTLCLLATTDPTWSILDGPLTSVDPDGLATAGYLFADTPATVRASYDGIEGDLVLVVLNLIYPGGAMPVDSTIVDGTGIELSWNPVDGATGYQVYFGTSLAAVQNATTGSSEFGGFVTDPAFLIASLPPGSEIFWRIDTVTGDGVIPGDPTFFTTAIYRPDLRIGRQFAPDTHRGDDVYENAVNGPGPQFLSEKIRRGKVSRFHLSIENDGNFPDRIEGSGRRIPQRRFRSNFFQVGGAGAGNITGALARGAYTRDYDSGQTQSIRATIRARNRIRVPRLQWTMRVRSVADNSQADINRLRAEFPGAVRRGGRSPGSSRKPVVLF
ncbi:MAG: hypothetical protein P1U81_19375 [Verrucomicrobiales bacterium]|nr:hypothetical protein [Verrucomicrobiales bacterium]